LLRLCDEYPETWRKGEVYYFYIDMGGRYHYIEEEKWLRGKKINITLLSYTKHVFR
jgi:hypothetical protein